MSLELSNLEFRGRRAGVGYSADDKAFTFFTINP